MTVTKDNWREKLASLPERTQPDREIENFEKLVALKKMITNPNNDPRWLKALKPGAYEFLLSVEE